MERIPFPEIKLVPSPLELAKRLGRFILGTNGVPLHYSDHYNRDHFQEPVEQSAEQPADQPHTQMHFEYPHHETHDHFVLNRDEHDLGWDSEGTYFHD